MRKNFEQNQEDRAKTRVQKYRQKLKANGMVRLEVLIESNYKKHFDELVAAKSEDYPPHLDQRQRTAQAKQLILKEALGNTQTSFIALTEEIESLKAEIRALSPAFFKTDLPAEDRIPEAILALPDDPTTLKRRLAKYHKEQQKLASTAKEYKRRAEQYYRLYEAASDENERINAQINEKI